MEGFSIWQGEIYISDNARTARSPEAMTKSLKSEVKEHTRGG